MTLNRRAFVAATAASVAAPAVARAKECPAAGMDWMTMSLEARNLAYFNVAHVGADFARQKTEHWTAASKDLRERRPKHLDLAYRPGERTKWDLYPAADPKAPCFVHIHGGYWQRGSKEIFACLAEGALANGWSAARPGYTLAPEASLTQITNELRSAFDWLNAKGAEHGIGSRSRNPLSHAIGPPVPTLLGHKSIQHTVRHTELASTRFKSLF